MTHSFPTRRSSDLGGLIPSASSRFDLRRIDSPSASYYETITSVRFHDFTIPHPRRTAGGSLHFREPDMTLYSIYQRDPITGHMNIVAQIECASDLEATRDGRRYSEMADTMVCLDEQVVAHLRRRPPRTPASGVEDENEVRQGTHARRQFNQ